MTIASGRFLAKRAVGYLTVAILMSFLPLHAQVTQDRDLWFVCNATNHPLPTTATLTHKIPRMPGTSVGGNRRCGQGCIFKQHGEDQYQCSHG